MLVGNVLLPDKYRITKSWLSVLTLPTYSLESFCAVENKTVYHYSTTMYLFCINVKISCRELIAAASTIRCLTIAIIWNTSQFYLFLIQSIVYRLRWTYIIIKQTDKLAFLISQERGFYFINFSKVRNGIYSNCDLATYPVAQIVNTPVRDLRVWRGVDAYTTDVPRLKYRLAPCAGTIFSLNIYLFYQQIGFVIMLWYHLELMWHICEMLISVKFGKHNRSKFNNEYSKFRLYFSISRPFWIWISLSITLYFIQFKNILWCHHEDKTVNKYTVSS